MASHQLQWFRQKELKAKTSEAESMWRKAMASTLAASLVLSGVPTAAIAQELGQPDASEGEVPTVLSADDTAPSQADDAAIQVIDDQEANPQQDETATTDASEQDDVAAEQADATEAQASATDLTMSDIALPKGLSVTTDQGIIVTGEVDPSILAAMEQSATNTSNASGDTTYAAGQLGYVDQTASQVKELGSGIFDAISAGTSGYVKAGVVGAKKLLELAGVLGSKDALTPELLAETKRLNALVEDMSERLDENTKQTYQNRLTIFDNAVGALDIECTSMETMYQKGYALAEKRGLTKTADKNGGLNNVLVKLMRDEDAKGNADFRDFSALMGNIRTNFETVAVEGAKDGGSSPFYAFDSYWALYFNFDSQGYYLRQAYRTNVQLQLKRSYTLLALYNDLPQTLDAGKKAEPITAALQAALKGIEAQPAGTSPEAAFSKLGESKTSRYLKVPVHCYTTGRDYSRAKCWSWMGELDPDEQMNEDQARAFCDRLHGHTVAEDLRLAGLMVEYSTYWDEYAAAHGKSIRIDEAHYPGLGLNYDVDGEWENIYLPFDATGYSPKRCSSRGYLLLTLDNDGLTLG